MSSLAGGIAADPPSDEPACSLVARPIAFEAIPRATWDALLARTARATPFSRWTVHRAWWDAYSETAHPQYLACAPAGAGQDPAAIRAIVPLMHRHEVEADDAATATILRQPGSEALTHVAPTAKAIFFGASYHADYATVLCDPTDLSAAAAALVDVLAGPPDGAHGSKDWDVVDLRRLRDDDPALGALESAFQTAADRNGWTVTRDWEDVCPVVTLPADGGWESYLGMLGKKDRHEIRRKIRRAEAAGPNEFTLLPPTPDAIETFITLHEARWGEQGLFPATAGGERSRRFIGRLAELELADGEERELHVGQFSVAGRVIFSGLAFESGPTCYFYNAGLAPDARELSPGVTGTAATIRDRLENGGCRTFDFLRGAEPYKYEWGAHNEPIHRLLVTRTEDR